MASEVTPYIPRAAGDILSASDWNQLQLDIKKDIGDQIEKALGQVDDVPHSGDSDKLEGKTLDEITQDIVRKTLEAIKKDCGGYVTLFRRLELGEETLIEHSLGAFPLTDVYQLEYFPAVCGFREDYEYEPVRWVNFFLYHGTERKIRIPSRETSKSVMIEIEETDVRPARVKFSDLLMLYDVKYTETTDLEELEAGFWDAFFQRPDCDDFEPRQYGHSPWFERCCGERRSVKELKERGDWDRLYLKMRTRKTINLLGSHPFKKTTKRTEEVEDFKDHVLLFTATETNTRTYPRTIVAAPNQVQIVHYDFDTLGVRLIDRPIYAEDHIRGFKHDEKRSFPPLPKEWLEDLKVMILLKV
jgi:hypothetical protein